MTIHVSSWSNLYAGVRGSYSQEKYKAANAVFCSLALSVF